MLNKIIKEPALYIGIIILTIVFAYLYFFKFENPNDFLLKRNLVENYKSVNIQQCEDDDKKLIKIRDAIYVKYYLEDNYFIICHK